MEEQDDILVDLIIKEMKFGQDHPFHELYMSAIFKVKVNATIRKTITEPIENIYSSSEFDHPIRFLKEYMIDEKLIEENKQSIGDYGHPVILTLHGRKIQKKGGWLKYLRSQEINRKPKHHWSGIGANVATIGMFCLTAFAIYQSVDLTDKSNKIKEYTIRIERLTRDSLKQSATKDSLLHLLKMNANKPDSNKK